MEEFKTGEIKTRIFDMSGLRLCLYGLIITVIDINIQGFDIFPDVIGYIMAIIGLGKIEQYEEKFGQAKRIAIILAVLAAINIVQPQNQNTSGSGNLLQTTNVTFSAGIFGNIPWLAMLLMFVGVAANIAFIYMMCTGMKNLLTRTGDETLAEICDNRLKLILFAQIGLFASLLLALLPASFGGLVAIVFGVMAFIAMILFLLLINHTYRSIDGKEAF